jgi:acylphosphatase
MTEDTPRRWTLLFSGTVQGVGFRYTTERVARNHPVSGYVRNLPDGRVEVVAEGGQNDLRSFLKDILEAMAGYVRDQEVAESPGTGEFDGFGVRF